LLDKMEDDVVGGDNDEDERSARTALPAKMVSRDVCLVVLIVVTGTFNIMGAKALNKSRAEGTDRVVRAYNHPFLHTWSIFLGCIGFYVAGKLYFLVRFLCTGKMKDWQEVKQV
jgi:hypothetical protein